MYLGVWDGMEAYDCKTWRWQGWLYWIAPCSQHNESMKDCSLRYVPLGLNHREIAILARMLGERYIVTARPTRLERVECPTNDVLNPATHPSQLPKRLNGRSQLKLNLFGPQAGPFGRLKELRASSLARASTHGCAVECGGCATVACLRAFEVYVT